MRGAFGDSGEMMVSDHRVTAAGLQAARVAFEADEPRDLFYRAATELVDLALRGATSLTVAEAVAVLLQTWNKAYYQYHKFDNAHFASVEKLLVQHRAELLSWRHQTINNVSGEDRTAMSTVFRAFELVLGPVGAAKALHLLAPQLFPLWDRAIAKAYGLALGTAGSNGNRYWKFLLIVQHQCSRLAPQDAACENLLKSIDEYNYCKHTKGWLP
jgi:hypothetical protein